MLQMHQGKGGPQNPSFYGCFRHRSNKNVLQSKRSECMEDVSSAELRFFNRRGKVLDQHSGLNKQSRALGSGTLRNTVRTCRLFSVWLCSVWLCFTVFIDVGAWLYIHSQCSLQQSDIQKCRTLRRQLQNSQEQKP